MINRARIDAGVPPVQLGSNPAAQIHADAMAEHCFGGHWGLDGTTSVIRYTLAGGLQSSGENVSGYGFCPAKPIATMRTALEMQTAGLLASPGHRETMLDPSYKYVNIGIGWGEGELLYLVQQFEGDYVRYTEVPAVDDGKLRLAGKTVNGAVVDDPDDLGVRLVLSPPLNELTRGQFARTACLDAGLLIAQLRKPPEAGLRYNNYRLFQAYKRCPSPYDVPAESPAPSSSEESKEMHEEAREHSRQLKMSSYFADALLVTAAEWKAENNEFAVVADISRLLDEYGPGVYAVHVGAMLNGKMETISNYSIFYQTEPPTGYGNR